MRTQTPDVTALSNAQLDQHITDAAHRCNDLLDEHQRLTARLAQLERDRAVASTALHHAQYVRAWRQRAGVSGGDILASFQQLQPWVRGAVITTMTLSEPPADDLAAELIATVTMRLRDGRHVTITFDQVIGVCSVWEVPPDYDEQHDAAALALALAHPEPLDSIVEDECYLFISGPGDPIGALMLRVYGELFAIDYPAAPKEATS